MSNLTNNSGQTFKTTIYDKVDGVIVGVLDASSFTEAVYRIFAADCTTALVTATLTGADIAVVSDTDPTYGVVNVFETTLTKAAMLDTIVPASQYTHSFKVTNSAGLELPPVFQNTVTVVRACD
jgi:hypothetical protein